MLTVVGADACLESGTAQRATFQLVQHQWRPQQYLWDAAWDTVFLLAQTNILYVL